MERVSILMIKIILYFFSKRHFPSFFWSCNRSCLSYFLFSCILMYFSLLMCLFLFQILVIHAYRLRSGPLGRPALSHRETGTAGPRRRDLFVCGTLRHATSRHRLALLWPKIRPNPSLTPHVACRDLGRPAADAGEAMRWDNQQVFYSVSERCCAERKATRSCGKGREGEAGSWSASGLYRAFF